MPYSAYGEIMSGIIKRVVQKYQDRKHSIVHQLNIFSKKNQLLTLKFWTTRTWDTSNSSSKSFNISIQL